MYIAPGSGAEETFARGDPLLTGNLRRATPGSPGGMPHLAKQAGSVGGLDRPADAVTGRRNYVDDVTWPRHGCDVQLGGEQI